MCACVMDVRESQFEIIYIAKLFHSMIIPHSHSLYNIIARYKIMS